MKTVKVFFLMLLATFVLESYKPIKNSGATVYICTTGKVYHSTKYCKGLIKAKHPIVKVYKKDAIKKMKRRACKFCYYGDYY